MSCHDIGRGMDSVTQFIIKMYDAGEITRLVFLKLLAYFIQMISVFFNVLLDVSFLTRETSEHVSFLTRETSEHVSFLTLDPCNCSSFTVIP